MCEEKAEAKINEKSEQRHENGQSTTNDKI